MYSLRSKSKASQEVIGSPLEKKRCSKTRKKDFHKEKRSSRQIKKNFSSNKQQKIQPYGETIAEDSSSLSDHSCCDLSVRLSPWPKLTVQKHINLSNKPECSSLKAWLNSNDSDRTVDKSEVQIVSNNIAGKTTVKNTPKQPLKRKSTGKEKIPFSIFRDPSSNSGSDTSTPVSQSITAPAYEAKENLFGFEKLLQPTKSLQLDQCKVSPIVGDLSSHKVKKPLQSRAPNLSRKAIEKQSFNKTIHKKVDRNPDSLLLKSKQKKTTVKHSHQQSEITLFDATTESRNNQAKLSQVDAPATNIASLDQKNKLARVKKVKLTKNKPKRTNVVQFNEQEIAWEEIMHHELGQCLRKSNGDQEKAKTSRSSTKREHSTSTSLPQEHAKN